jgi:myo-inositol-1(or 4)-monophosphatase
MKETLVKAAKAGGKVVNEYRYRTKDLTLKSYKDYVTNVDINSEDVIIKTIKSKFPGHGIHSEEKGTEREESDYLWIIDPLDGTHNYIFNIPFFMISIALAYKKEVIMGAIYSPAMDELYYAEKGKGAFLNGKPIEVAAQKTLNESLILYDNQFHNHKDMLPNFNELIKHIFTIRILGSAASDLCFVARGYATARILHKPKLCDFAAGALIVEEAGGKVTDFQGNKWDLNTEGVIASNGYIHNELLEILEPRDYTRLTQKRGNERYK